MSAESPQAKGGRARAAALSAAERSEQASLAAKTRWTGMGKGGPDDKELMLLAKAMRALSSMEPDGRRRALVYLKGKFSAEWPSESY